jgi:hypothetical protein
MDAYVPQRTCVDRLTATKRCAAQSADFKRWFAFERPGS